MHTETVERIDGPVDVMFRNAVRVEDWPRLLLHYRAVRVFVDEGPARFVETKARRGRIPIWWWARQVVVPEARCIRYTHTRGVTRGMEVEWRFEPGPRGDVTVTIVHDRELRRPLVGHSVARWIVGPMFVVPTAAATLRRIKRVVEEGLACRGARAP